MCSIETSPTINAIGAALLAFQEATHGVVKDSRNPHFKNRYASLEAVIEAARPGLQENGLAFLQAPGRVVSGALEVSTMLMHPKSGEWIRSTMSTPLQKQDPQGVGSALTYCQRYALMACLGLPAVDDDAEATTRREPANEHPAVDSVQLYIDKSRRYIENETRVANLKAWWEREADIRADFGLVNGDTRHDLLKSFFIEKGKKLSAASIIRGPEAA